MASSDDEIIRTTKTRRAAKKHVRTLQSYLVQNGLFCDSNLPQVYYSSSLPENALQKLWSLVEENMKAMLEQSSLGWNPEEKRLETFHKDARFLIFYEQKTNTPDRSSSQIAGFSMFRFEGDDQGPESLIEDVVYCWEVQIDPKFRRKGLAGQLVEALKVIGAKCDMDKIILTVLKCNEGALSLYYKHDFAIDPSSPKPEEGTDYEIMSFDLRKYRQTAR